jgi:hypothetical protein
MAWALCASAKAQRAGQLTRRLHVEPRDAAKQREAKARTGVAARKAFCLNLLAANLGAERVKT